MNDIKARLREYLASNILFSDNGFEYGDDESFLAAGIVDSMGVMELVTFVGETWGIEVRPEDVTAENFDSVTRLARYVRGRMPGAGEAAA